MTAFIARRLVQAIPTFFGITILSYFIMWIAPGDPVSIMTFDPTMSQETRDALATRLGVNDPPLIQYGRWLLGDWWFVIAHDTWYQVETEDGTRGWLSDKMLEYNEETGEMRLLATRQPYRDTPDLDAEVAGDIRRRDNFSVVDTVIVDVYGERRGILLGDFGNSFQAKRPALDLIFERFPASFELNIAVILVGMIFGWIIGVLAAVWRGSVFDQGSRVLAVVGDAIPVFWLAFMVILIFGAPGLDWLPMGGRCAPVRGGCPPIWERLEYLILPTLVLALGGIAGWSRYLRAAMLDTINSEYIRTAQSKGLSQREIWFKHALRNALIPMATFLGPTIVAFYGGAVIIEQIFAWPGMGRLLLQAVVAQDYPVVMASVVIGSLLTILGYILSDILYAMFDPRIRLC